jgi:hypothetical protein
MPMFSLFVPKQAVGASLVYFDFFNASGSASNIWIYSLQPIVSGAAAVTGVLGVDLFLTRTSTVGTGGTAATREGTDTTATTFAGIDTQAPLDNNISARITPTGGATAGSVLDWGSVFTEETNSAAYNVGLNLARVPGLPDIPPILMPENSGIRIVQGAVASVGNIGFNILFNVAKK